MCLTVHSAAPAHCICVYVYFDTGTVCQYIAFEGIYIILYADKDEREREGDSWRATERGNGGLHSIQIYVTGIYTHEVRGSFPDLIPTNWVWNWNEPTLTQVFMKYPSTVPVLAGFHPLCPQKQDTSGRNGLLFHYR